MAACLNGGALGDAFAMRRGAGADSDPDQPLAVSADTQLVCFTLDGLRRGIDAGESSVAGLLDWLRDSYLDWLATQRSDGTTCYPGGPLDAPALRVQRHPGRTCLTALALGARGTIEQPANHSKGSGAVARSAPIGFLGSILGPRGVFELAARAAALTHGHPSGYLSAGSLALIVHYLLEDRPIATAAERAVDELARWSQHEETVSTLLAAINEWDSRRRNHSQAIRRLGRGRVAEEALAIGLYAALVGGEVSECLAIAASPDVNSESPVVIAGQIAGARRARASVPGIDAHGLEVTAVLQALIDTLPELPAAV